MIKCAIGLYDSEANEILTKVVTEIATKRNIAASVIPVIVRRCIENLSYTLMATRDSVIFEMVYSGIKPYLKYISKNQAEELYRFGFCKNMPYQPDPISEITEQQINDIATLISIQITREHYKMFNSSLLLAAIDGLIERHFFEDNKWE